MPNIAHKERYWKGTDAEWKKYEFRCLVKSIKRLQWYLTKLKKKDIDINIVARYRLLKMLERYSLRNKKNIYKSKHDITF
jgi:hypothetical protein